MGRKKTAEETQATGEDTLDQHATDGMDNPPGEPAIAGTPPSGTAMSAQGEGNRWVSRFGSWGDYEAGVRLIEDRQNRRMTIKFAEKPSATVRNVLKSKENGYRFDDEEFVWYKAINQGKPRQSREEAEQLAFAVANIIREEKGLPKKESHSLGM